MQCIIYKPLVIEGCHMAKNSLLLFLLFVLAPTAFAGDSYVESKTSYSAYVKKIQAKFTQPVNKVRIVFMDNDWMMFNASRRLRPGAGLERLKEVYGQLITEYI